MNKTVSIFVRLILVILLIALLLGVVGMLYAFIGNGQRNFYVKFGDEILASEKKNVEFDKNKVYVFYCGTFSGHTVDYETQIFVNVQNIENFDFSVDGNRKNFKSDMTEYDCSGVFNLVKGETCFYLCVPNDLTLFDIVKSKYPDNELANIPNIPLKTANSFVLTVTDGVEKTKTEIYFC